MIEHLQPSPPAAHLERDVDCRVVGLGTEDADLVFAALASDTRRTLFTAVCEAPGTPSALADRTGTSLQNSLYHLRRLEAAGLVEVVHTRYSPKGREMNVYAPTNAPLAVVMGAESRLAEIGEHLRGESDAACDGLDGEATGRIAGDRRLP